MKKILSEIRTSHYVLPERWVFKSVTSKSGFVWRRIYCLIIFKSTVLSTQIPMYRKLYRYVRGFISSVQCGCAFLKEAEYSVFCFFLAEPTTGFGQQSRQPACMQPCSLRSCWRTNSRGLTWFRARRSTPSKMCPSYRERRWTRRWSHSCTSKLFQTSTNGFTTCMC